MCQGRDCRGKGVSGLIGPGVSGRKGRMMTKTVVAVQPSQNYEDGPALWRLLTFPVVAMLMS
ncbi:putative transposase domain protein [Mycobacterium ulcerans str. Harvey]|uniref:Transposase domain protein n=1 Tax=Mycobacterium ulcerans str. Harvey TaxID=1299332 RepID=A0ABN0QNX0_MYCUL|nr:putative transposase domain protein [Mycobacterium ulcerans str. Harvey]